MDDLAGYLLEKESITGKEFMKIFNRYKGITEDGEGSGDEDSDTGAVKDEADPENAGETSDAAKADAAEAEETAEVPADNEAKEGQAAGETEEEQQG